MSLLYKVRCITPEISPGSVFYLCNNNTAHSYIFCFVFKDTSEMYSLHSNANLTESQVHSQAPLAHPSSSTGVTPALSLPLH